MTEEANGYGEFRAAYFAGFFDGEGHVSIQRNGRSDSSDGQRHWRYALRIGVANTNRAVIESFAAWTGVGLVIRENTSNQRRNKGLPMHYWEANGARAVAVLERLLPHLMVKREQAEIGIRFYKWHQRVIAEKRGRGQGSKYSDGVLKQFQEFRIEMLLCKTNRKSLELARVG